MIYQPVLLGNFLGWGKNGMQVAFKAKCKWDQQQSDLR